MKSAAKPAIAPGMGPNRSPAMNSGSFDGKARQLVRNERHEPREHDAQRRQQCAPGEHADGHGLFGVVGHKKYLLTLIKVGGSSYHMQKNDGARCGSWNGIAEHTLLRPAAASHPSGT